MSIFQIAWIGWLKTPFTSDDDRWLRATTTRQGRPTATMAVASKWHCSLSDLFRILRFGLFGRRLCHGRKPARTLLALSAGCGVRIVRICCAPAVADQKADQRMKCWCYWKLPTSGIRSPQTHQTWQDLFFLQCRETRVFTSVSQRISILSQKENRKPMDLSLGIFGCFFSQLVCRSWLFGTK